jgi:hypothetical protein
MSNQNAAILFRKYLNDISDFKLLDEEMIKNINNMSNNEKMQIILAFNDAVKGLTFLIDIDKL